MIIIMVELRGTDVRGNEGQCAEEISHPHEFYKIFKTKSEKR